MNIIYYHSLRLFGIGEDCEQLSSAKELATAAKAVLAQTTISFNCFLWFLPWRLGRWENKLEFGPLLKPPRRAQLCDCQFRECK
jgi:hypothetical protein